MLKWLFVPLILSFAAVSACGGNDSAVEKARGFTGFDVWWLGEESGSVEKRGLIGVGEFESFV